MKLSADHEKTLLLQRQILWQGNIDANRQEEISASIIYLNVLDVQSPITLFIDSVGGSSEMGAYISDVIRTSKSPVHGVVIGLCGSAAFDILQACNKRIAHKNSCLIFHSTRVKEFRINMNRKKAIAWLDKLRVEDEQALKHLACRSGQKLKQLKAWAEEEKKFSGTEALALNLIDEVR